MGQTPNPVNPVHGGVHNTTSFQLAPGETNVYGEVFSPAILAPYLKTQLMCSSTRFVFQAPNTVLGFIPVGSANATFPVNSIASVSTSTHFRLGHFLGSLAMAIIGLMFMSSGEFSGIIFGFILLALGAAGISGSFPAALMAQNHAGGTTVITVSPFERAKLAQFTAELQQRVFADQSQIHHEEAQSLRTQQLMMQQLALQQQMGTAQQQQAFNQMQLQQQMGQQAQVPQGPADPNLQPGQLPAPQPQQFGQAPQAPAAPQQDFGQAPQAPAAPQPGQLPDDSEGTQELPPQGV